MGKTKKKKKEKKEKKNEEENIQLKYVIYILLFLAFDFLGVMVVVVGCCSEILVIRLHAWK